MYHFSLHLIMYALCAFLKTCQVSNWSMKMVLVSCVTTAWLCSAVTDRVGCFTSLLLLYYVNGSYTCWISTYIYKELHHDIDGGGGGGHL
jgi:hypothetical protein